MSFPYTINDELKNKFNFLYIVLEVAKIQLSSYIEDENWVVQ